MPQVGYEITDRNLEFLNQPIFSLYSKTINQKPKRHYASLLSS